MENLKHGPSGKRSLLSEYSRTLGELTAHHRAQQALRAAKVESDLANRAKSDFLANMSHELRTPLNAIIGFSDLIRTLASAPDLGHSRRDKTAEYAVDIAKAGRRLLGLLSDILDLSEIDSQRIQLQIEPNSINEVVDVAVAIVHERITIKNQNFRVTVADPLPLIDVDAGRLKQTLLNLLSNAHKFTPEGGEIRLSAEATPDGGVTLTIGDTGIGMTDEQIAVALRPFGQVQQGYARRYEGIGLGLSIAAALTKLHRGQLEIASELGVGTNVTVSLPPSGWAGGFIEIQASVKELKSCA